MWIVFISILRAGNGLTAGLLVYCTGALIGCCEGEMLLNVEIELRVGKTYQWESELVICNKRQAVKHYLILIHNLPLQYTPCCLTLIQMSL